ncbi:hypothetical protein [Cronobacter dublinensis]|uniref:hypothetical protein n=1 Tax=Cronobacter dublinensis TaxID=413497 RepID=UPI001ED8E06E|nr:hypothetical protein [Cronobacter dublinensis]
MERIQNLINVLGLCIPELEKTLLLADLPEDTETETVLHWLYKKLAAQNQIAYEEWKEYSGYIPDLKPLTILSLTEEPADFIFTIIENIDWSAASIDPFELPYVIPWLEHINFYLKPYGLRLVDLLPFENAYIFCVRDDERLLEKLNLTFESLGMGINLRQAMDQQQVSADVMSLIYE